MKGKTILGVALSLMLMVSLLAFAAPVSAGTLSWSDETIPSTDDKVIQLGSDVTDIAVAADGETIYAASGVLMDGTFNVTTGGELNIVATDTTKGTVEASLTGTTTDLLGVFAATILTTFTFDSTIVYDELSISGTITETSLTFSGTIVALQTVPDNVVVSQTITISSGEITVEDGVVTVLDLSGDSVTIGLDEDSVSLVTVFALYRSSDAGESWSGLSIPDEVTKTISFVAVAPDDANFIAIAAADGTEDVYVSDDAGATWDPLVWPTSDGPTTINDMALSVEESGNHFLAVTGVGDAGAEVWNYEIGAVGAVWEEISADFTGFKRGDVAGAVAFSPNFASDEVLTAVTGGRQGNPTLGPNSVWSTDKKVSGYYSAYLEAVTTSSHPYVDLTPPTGIMVADFVAAPEDFSFWYLTTGWAPFLELQFSDGTDFVDITFMLQTYGVTGGSGQVANLGTTTFQQISIYDWESGGEGQNNFDSDLAAALAFLALKFAGYELTRVRAELYPCCERTSYIDDVTIDGTTYTMEPTVDFQVFSFNQDQWNVFSGYPVPVVEYSTDALIAALDSASISLAPDYLGSDDAMRLAFVGLTADSGATEGEDSGIFRLDDDDVDTLKDEVFIHSVDYDGTNLVAGEYDDVTVYRCADPLASSPSVKSSAGLKSPGGEELTVVAWAGDEVVAGTTGDESAFAVSRTDGKCFNDISLMDTTLATLSDVAVSADGSKVYLATADGDSDLSLWRYASTWERVLTVQGAGDDYIVRLAPDDADVVYVADLDGTTIYYSADGGETRWHTRISRYPITDDLAVETDGGVLYVLTTSGYVSRSNNSGFTWASKKSSEITGNMLLSVGEDELLVGSTDGYVSYSTDGGTTWTKLDDDIDGIVQVAASGVTTADSIYAASNEAGDYIYRWDWDDEEWDEITEDGDLGVDYQVWGLVLFDGALYAVAANTSDNASMSLRTLDPTSDDPTWSTMTEEGVLFNATPSALRVSGASSKMWAIDTIEPALYSYEDTLAVTAPSLVSPKHGFTDGINPVTGRAMDVTFVWEKPSSKVEGYQLRIALDEGFDEEIRTIAVVSDDDVVSQIVGPFGAKDAEVEFMPDTTYYWKVRVNNPIYSPWSIVYTLSVEEAAAAVTEVIVEPAPAPEVTVTAPPAPEVTVTVPPAPAPITPAPAIPAYLLWTIIIIGAVLMIALIVLIVRTRRVV